ncbi:hypothetical protein BO79DRAFT_218316 [Aspergillus costaricaensis CBS 115574]|uniref:Uncharacterized protein n=1 Tax=Aspergillus costaricaensis CBS 115574 TaxID=1448317 RepID=A0ACD1ICG6_9EURO|nr:hypothetical protein BO79DRAFT_218316 [Aspergillus costaricaensis CBS 115574]RAK87964.1 hypothetical protein BO79DRAFT_218316 [Aspergillus costaricaensis CBS 115574]
MTCRLTLPQQAHRVQQHHAAEAFAVRVDPGYPGRPPSLLEASYPLFANAPSPLRIVSPFQYKLAICSGMMLAYGSAHTSIYLPRLALVQITTFYNQQQSHLIVTTVESRPKQSTFLIWFDFQDNYSPNAWFSLSRNLIAALSNAIFPESRLEDGP